MEDDFDMYLEMLNEVNPSEAPPEPEDDHMDLAREFAPGRPSLLPAPSNRLILRYIFIF